MSFSSTHNVNVAAKTGDVEKRFRAMKKLYMAGDDDALLLFEAEFAGNPSVAKLCASMKNERFDRDYKAWLDDMNPESGIAS